MYLNENIGTPSALIAYSHGVEDALVLGSTRIICAHSANFDYSKILVYSIACLSGQMLGPKLIALGCKCFIGYKNSVFKPIDTDDKVNDMVRCENIALILMLSDGRTAVDAFEKMHDCFTRLYDKYLGLNQIITASIILEARQSLVILGDETASYASL